MQIEITPELAEVRAALRRFTVGTLEPLALEVDRTGEVPARAWAAMREHGYLGMRLSSAAAGSISSPTASRSRSSAARIASGRSSATRRAG